jgi:hypothetical protein
MVYYTIVEARQVFRFRDRQGELTVDMVIWQLPRPSKERPHGLKYRLYCGHGAECVVRYDNETPKGDHRHYGAQEEPYGFESVEKLMLDFRQDCVRLTSWRWT